MRDWKAESRRIRAGIKALTDGWPFHLRPDLRQQHDELAAEGLKLLNQAADLRNLALHGADEASGT